MAIYKDLSLANPITFGAGFNINNNSPIDTRLLVQTYEALKALNKGRLYGGMIVSVADDPTNRAAGQPSRAGVYMLKSQQSDDWSKLGFPEPLDPSLDSSWVKIATVDDLANLDIDLSDYVTTGSLNSALSTFYNTSVSPLSTAINSISTTVSSLSTNVTQLGTAIDSVSTAVGSLSTSINSISTTVSSLSTSISTIGGALDNYKVKDVKVSSADNAESLADENGVVSLENYVTTSALSTAIESALDSIVAISSAEISSILGTDTGTAAV